MSELNTNIFLQKNITVSDFILESVKRWYILVISFILAVLISIIYTLGFVTPLYTSEAKIFILSKQTDEYYTSTDFSISTYLSYDFVEIIIDSPILDEVAKDLDNKYTTNQLKHCVNVIQPENTRIIEISAQTPNAKDSKKIVDSICENAKEKLVDLMRLDSIEIIKKGTVPKKPSSPNLISNILLAVAFTFLISEIGIAINFAFNNKVSSVNDIEKYLELNVLAAIPYNHSKTKGK